jgi:hypothetical protein
MLERYVISARAPPGLAPLGRRAAALDPVFSRKDAVAACAVRLEQQRTGPQASLLRYDDIDEHLPSMLPRVVPCTSQAFDRNDKDFPRRAKNTILPLIAIFQSATPASSV